MTDAVFLIVKYQSWIYVLAGLFALFYLRALARARRHLSRTPFGLEREVALQRQNSALAMLFVVLTLGAMVAIVDRAVAPALANRTEGPGAVLQTPTPDPAVLGAGDVLAIDSSGCRNPEATLTAPQPNERIAGAFEVRGTANIQNFAFYKFEIIGAATRGEWVPLGVGNEPKVDGDLGTFDASTYDDGDYAFRLIVLDSAGNFPPPCVVPVTIVNTTGP